MDNLRGHFPEHDDAADFDANEDDVGDELPPQAVGQDERRMQVRAYNFWATMLGDRNFPAIEDLDPESDTEFGPFSVLLDFTAGIDDPAIVFLGSSLAEECGAQNPISRLSDVPNRSLLSRITDHYLQIIANQAPIGFEAEFVNQRGVTILYRGILLPYSSDDSTIDFIYGVINWKELADQQTADELLLEIDQALEPFGKNARSELELTDWADSPTGNDGVLDLGIHEALPENHGDLPSPTFSSTARIETGDPNMTARIAYGDHAEAGLSDLLASARDLADEARRSEGRTRQALYAAISRAYDFSLAAARDPQGFALIVEDAGLAMQERAPMTPVVKLVFGADYDKTRLTEYATALGHAQRIGLGAGKLADHIAQAPGGLKGLLAEERRLRRAETGKDAAAAPRGEPRPALARKLRKLGAVAMADLPVHGSEFTVLLARRRADGGIELLGEAAGDVALVERAARRLLA